MGREGISKQATFLLEQLEGVPNEVPPLTNCCIMSNQNLVAHYIEAEVREAQGQTRGCLGWPPQRMRKLSGHLKGLRNTLEGSRKKWCDEENAIEVKRRQVNQDIVARVLKSEERRKAFEARWNEVKARNIRALDEGTFEGPIVPIGFKPPEAKAGKTSKNEAEGEKRSFFQLLDEPPEGLGRVLEGGSSGSSGPALPPEGVPPPAPPP